MPAVRGLFHLPERRDAAPHRLADRSNHPAAVVDAECLPLTPTTVPAALMPKSWLQVIPASTPRFVMLPFCQRKACTVAAFAPLSPAIWPVLFTPRATLLSPAPRDPREPRIHGE